MLFTVLLCIAGLFAASLIAALMVSRRVLVPAARFAAHLPLVLIGGVLSATAVAVLIGGDAPVAPMRLPLGLHWLGLSVALDGLSALFLLLIGGGAILCGLYGLGHDRADGPHPAAGLPLLLPALPAFVGFMAFVVIAADGYGFLLAWEGMSLLSWLLVLCHHADPLEGGRVRRAAFTYLAVAGVGTLALAVAFALVSAGSTTIAAEGETGLPDLGFDAIRATAHGAPTLAIACLLVVIGAGSKAGLLPLHAWLPPAHAAAPAHVSALMSAVMTKVAVYALLRLIFDLFGGAAGGATPPAAIAAGLTVIGGLGAVLGALQASQARDVKRLLAFSTVENLGIILFGVGLALTFKVSGLSLAALLALTGALLHAINHGLFKSLLFLGAGNLLTATGSRDLERMGGLIHRMPATAAAMLVGVTALAALPPLNGFASEWLLLQAIIAGQGLPHPALKLLMPVGGALLALAAALAAAAAVKLFGMAFLGRPRTTASADAHDPGGLMVLPLFLAALLCVALGAVPSLGTGLVLPVAAQLATPGSSGDLELLAAASGLAGSLVIAPPALTGAPAGPGLSGLLLLALPLLGIGIVLLVFSRLQRAGLTTPVRRTAVWDCGFPLAPPAFPSPPAQYTAASLTQPLRRVFGRVSLAASERALLPEPGERSPGRLETSSRDPAVAFVFAPVGRAILALADRLDPIRGLSLRAYVAMTFVTLIAMLLVVLATGGTAPEGLRP